MIYVWVSILKPDLTGRGHNLQISARPVLVVLHIHSMWSTGRWQEWCEWRKLLRCLVLAADSHVSTPRVLVRTQRHVSLLLPRRGQQELQMPTFATSESDWKWPSIESTDPAVSVFEAILIVMNMSQSQMPDHVRYFNSPLMPLNIKTWHCRPQWHGIFLLRLLPPLLPAERLAHGKSKFTCRSGLCLRFDLFCMTCTGGLLNCCYIW